MKAPLLPCGLHDPIEDACSTGTALAMVFKLLEAAQRSWRRLDGDNQLPKVVLGVKFNNGIEVIARPADLQPGTAAALAKVSGYQEASRSLRCNRILCPIDNRAPEDAMSRRYGRKI